MLSSTYQVLEVEFWLHKLQLHWSPVPVFENPFLHLVAASLYCSVSVSILLLTRLVLDFDSCLLILLLTFPLVVTPACLRFFYVLCLSVCLYFPLSTLTQNIPSLQVVAPRFSVGGL
ncbi:hypothetical protein GDO81_026987 [Engystomops pustulosus]|uniref:Uncharacterized protein n=1 Tax=Engystomops pustulosus TaxID=76066 RepID=A0AAV6YGF1_ENGPU|nr:hypothetical protein GDO81_026987 [Engystomops pustulosus]